jgi:hypothetical protein
VDELLGILRKKEVLDQQKSIEQVLEKLTSISNPAEFEGDGRNE